MERHTSSNAGNITDPAAVAAEVKAAIRTQLDSYAARDVDKASSILAPDTVILFHGAPRTSGKPAATESIRAQMADPALTLAVADETVDVAASGDMAVYRATYRFTFTHPVTKQPATEVGNWVAIFTRQPDGTMKLSLDVVVDMPAPAS